MRGPGFLSAAARRAGRTVDRPGIALACFLVLAALLPASAHAEERDPAPAPDPPPELSEIRDAVRGQVRGVAAAIDNFFSDEEQEAERNDSSMRLRLDTDYWETDGFGAGVSPRFRLRLPGIQHDLLFEAEGQSNTNDDPDGKTSQPSLDEDDDGDDDGFELRLRYLRSFDHVLIAPEVGLGFGSGVPRAFAGARVRRLWETDSDWTLQLIERLRIDTDRGLESVTTARADRLVFEDSLFRTDFSLRWREQKSGISYGPGTRLFIPLDDRSALSLEADLIATTHPDHVVDQVVGTVRYRRRILTEWTIVEVAPRIRFQHDDDYKADYGGLLRLELEF